MSLAVKTEAALAAVIAQVKHAARSACKTGGRFCNVFIIALTIITIAQPVQILYFSWAETVLLSNPWASISFLYLDSILIKSFDTMALSKSPSNSAISRRV